MYMKMTSHIAPKKTFQIPNHNIRWHRIRHDMTSHDANICYTQEVRQVSSITMKPKYPHGNSRRIEQLRPYRLETNKRNAYLLRRAEWEWGCCHGGLGRYGGFVTRKGALLAEHVEHQTAPSLGDVEGVTRVLGLANHQHVFE
jgi:hypothetical protein